MTDDHPIVNLHIIILKQIFQCILDVDCQSEIDHNNINDDDDINNNNNNNNNDDEDDINIRRSNTMVFGSDVAAAAAGVGEVDDEAEAEAETLPIPMGGNLRHQHRHIHEFAMVRSMLTLSLVCKHWLAIVPSLFYKYIHVGSIGEFRELVHLSRFGVLCQQRLPIQFQYVNIHLKQRHSKKTDRQVMLDLYREFLQDTQGCHALKIHQAEDTNDIGSQQDILASMGQNTSVHLLHLCRAVAIPCGLESLNLSYNRVSTRSFGDTLSLYIQTTCRLKHLNVSHCQLKESSYSIVSALLSNQTLLSINLNNTNISEDALVQFLAEVHTRSPNLCDITLLTQSYSPSQALVDTATQCHRLYCLRIR
ncbi:hypothetical protein SAMD00019534_104100, partial [Acytostelium subglobosum LB1]|uniref:hypothetical protein n=1 Tax=Acytostelium subglobosum LB1 TaxID=1410327 RepID=UPI000644B58A